MHVTEARRTRHLVLRMERGDELPSAMVRALDEAEARNAWITGVGTLEAAEIAIFDPAHQAYAPSRRIDSPSCLVSLAGNASLVGGTTTLHLTVTLARETEAGVLLLAGELIWARAFSVELHVVAFDDLSLGRPADDRVTAPMPPPRATTQTTVSSGGSEGTRTGTGAAPVHDGPMIPQKPVRKEEQVEIYPEVGDLATHFHFGECEVISSDGERIRLRQVRDGRVREVSLTMLRIGAPTATPEGKRLFQLTRKN